MVHMLSREGKAVNAIASNPIIVNALCGITRYSSLNIVQKLFGIVTIHIFIEI